MGLVDEIDQLALPVGLPAIGFQSELRRGLRTKLFNVGEGRMAVGVGLAGPQQVEVRAVKHVDRLGRTVGHRNPGNVAAGGGVIGNNRGKGKPLRPASRASDGSSKSKKGMQNLRKVVVNQCKGSAAARVAGARR